MVAMAAGCMVAWAAHAQTLDPIRIGAEDDWAPFSSAKDGEPQGLAVELVQAIFAEAGLAIELVPLPYARCMDEAKRGRLAGCFDTLPDASLRKDYLFHAKPLFTDAPWILARVDSPAERMTVQSLADKRVIVTHGYTYGEAFESNAAIQRVSAPYDINALRMLVAERADLAVVYRRVTQHLQRTVAQDLQGKFKPVGQLDEAALYLSFSRLYPDVQTLVRRFDEAHARLRKNGVLQRIEKRWN